MKYAMAVLLVALAGCEQPRPTPEFWPGDMVRSVVSGQVGQVVTQRCWPGDKACSYDVRFMAQQINADVGFGADRVDMLPLAVIEYMRPYELEMVKELVP